MDEEHHSTSMVANSGVGVGSKIIQKVVRTDSSIGSGNGLFGSNVTKTNEDGIFDGYAIV